MKTIFASGLLLATAFTTSAFAQTSVEDFVGPVAADAPDVAALDARCDRLLGEARRRIAELETSKAPYTVEKTLVSYDQIDALLSSVGAEFYSFGQSADTPEKRKAGVDCGTKVDALATEIGLSRPIYDHLKAIPVPKGDATTAYFLSRTLAAYERGGVAADAATRTKVKALQDELSVLGSTFDQNIANSRRSIFALPGELTGMPADWVASHKPGPDGLIEITTDYPDYQPVMSYAENDALREKVARVYSTRAYPANDEILGQIFTKRDQLAKLLGRKDYASLSLEDRMLNTPAKVIAHMAELKAAATAANEYDMAELHAALAEIRPGQQLNAFNIGIATQRVLKSKYDLDSQEVRKYFTYDNVRQGVFDLTQDLFGFQIRPWNTPRWHPDVETFEIVQDGKVLGQFYLDSHPRDGKYKHGNHIGLRRGVSGEGLPVSVLTMNLPKGGYDTGLMQHGDVETFLHEFGHLVHSILAGNQRWHGHSGVANEWDFVEAPSQMLQEWIYDYDTLAKFARNEKGEVIPRELVAKMNSARKFGMGIFEMRQLGLSNASLRYHMGAPTDPSAAGITGAYRTYFEPYSPIPLPADTHSEATFGHLNGYAAAYYTYGWSRVIAADLFSRFETAGLRDRATAEAYRKLILEPGGSKPSAMLIKEFLGRPVNADALKRKLAGAK